MSEQKQLAPDILLDKVMALYPHGIPREVIRRATVAPAATDDALNDSISAHGVASVTTTKCLFCVVSSSELTGPEQELLSAIAEKGLRVHGSEYEVMVVPALDAARQLVAKRKTEGRPQVVLVFGTNKPSSDVSKSGPLWVLGTYTVSDIASDVETKKTFWQHLKGLLPIISTL